MDALPIVRFNMTELIESYKNQSNINDDHGNYDLREKKSERKMSRDLSFAMDFFFVFVS